MEQLSNTKKKYETPVIYHYGDIREITQTNGMTGNNDSTGGGNGDKSQP